MSSRSFCQTSEHETNHANANHRLAMIQADLVVTTESARLVKPTEGPFYYPTFRKDLKTFGPVASSHNLQPEFAKGTKLLNPLNQASQVATIGPDDLQSAMHRYQEFDEILGGVAILHGGGRDHNGQNQSQAIHGHMAFAPRYLFGCVEAAFSCLIDRLDRLAINDSCGRCDLSS